MGDAMGDGAGAGDFLRRQVSLRCVVCLFAVLISRFSLLPFLFFIASPAVASAEAFLHELVVEKG